MEALGTTSLANKILEDKTKALFCPSAMLNSTPENEDDASTSEYDGENEVETDNLTSGKRKASKQVPKQVNKSSLRPKTMADVVEVNSRKKHAVDEVQNIHSLKVARVQDQCIQKKEQVISEKKGSKRAFCSPGSMSAYLEFRKKQKENNDAFVASYQSLNDSLTRNTRICGAAFNENDNDDADALSRWLDEADALNENDDDVGNEHEGVQELEDDLLSNYGREGMQETEPEKELEKAPNRKRHRGPTMLPKVHARTRDEREVIILNSLGQPVGPTREIVQEFKQFLGIVARDSELAPLNYINFPSLPTLHKMWEYVQEKYMVPEAGREWVMQAINGSWKAHKCFTKRNYFSAYPTDALRWFHKPDTISEPQFRELLQYWHSKEAEEISKINKDNRQLLDDMHTMGRNSYAILRHKLKQQDPDKQEPSQTRVYKESRKRTVGRKYLTNHEKIEENIAKMDALESSQHEDQDGSNSKDPYSEVIPDPKRKSRVRLQGKGVKKSDLKKKDKKSDFIFPTEFLESMQSQLVQQLAPSATTAILTQLWDANPGINLVIPDFAIPSAPKDASSAPHLLVDQNGQSSKSGATINQVHGESNGAEV
ncbi:uncharacterized protein LOC110710143 isoform X1 [Chenopodium quinoa]|uniref:uncharacterized protein LOC110710143 isoform X1 n=1 Tax=Chenopodium quinoa TaxID=63459 RepID=UPI000B79540B|nr:uncharacterized protein LOC110710143 isoform X1 [Chenopodium quinoa]